MCLRVPQGTCLRWTCTCTSFAILQTRALVKASNGPAEATRTKIDVRSLAKVIESAGLRRGAPRATLVQQAARGTSDSIACTTRSNIPTSGTLSVSALPNF